MRRTPRPALPPPAPSPPRSVPWLVRVLPAVLVVPLALAAPVATRPSPAPEPVAPSLTTVALPAVDQAGGEVALPARDTPRFTTLGVTWRRTATAPQLEVEVRTRDVGGDWQPWRDLHGASSDRADDASPDVADAGTERDGTAPVHVGPSDGVEVRVEVSVQVSTRGGSALPADLRVDLVDAGSSPADGVALQRPVDTAGAAAGAPEVVTRAGWGADESIRSCASGYTGTPRVAFVHHTATDNSYSRAEAPAAIRGIYAYHVRSNGWCDIGYNFLVDRFGTVYEGRAGGIERAVLGAHTGGFNANSFGTAMIGTFSSSAVPDALVGSLRRLLAWKLGASYADPTARATLTSASTSGSRYRAGTDASFSVVSGHRDAVNTSCPGDVGYGVLAALRPGVRDTIGAGLVRPSATPTATQVEPVRVTAGLLRRTAWQLTVTSTASGAVVRTLSGTGDSGLEAAWDLADAAGVPVPPGTYRLTLAGSAGGDEVVPWSTTVGVRSAAAPPAAPPPPVLPVPGLPAPVPTVPGPVPAGAAPAGSLFVPLPPTRVLDTRDGTGAARAPLGGGRSIDLRLAGVAGVPDGATAVALNLTATRPTAGTHLTVWPSGAAQPETAVLNLRRGTTAASLVVAGLGTGGAASIANLAGDVEVVADVVGFYARGSGAAYTPLAPARLLDTRTSGGGGALADQESRRLQVTGAGGVPQGATAAVLNVTAVAPPRAGYLTVSPASGARPGTSSVNFTAREVVPNRVITGLSADGAIDVFAAGGGQVLVDVVGFYGPTGRSSYTAVPPTRLVDSRDGTGTPRGAFAAATTRDLTAGGTGGVPAGATAVVLSLTATGVSASSTFVTAFPDGTSRPGTSDLNLVRGATRSNLAVVPLSPAGRFSLYNDAGTAHLVADVLGYYS